jgi:hypothetical protein
MDYSGSDPVREVCARLGTVRDPDAIGKPQRYLWTTGHR